MRLYSVEPMRVQSTNPDPRSTISNSGGNINKRKDNTNWCRCGDCKCIDIEEERLCCREGDVPW